MTIAQETSRSSRARRFFNLWGTTLQTISTLGAAAYFIFYGGMRLQEIQSTQAFQQTTLQKIEAAIDENRNANRAEHAVIFGELSEKNATDAAQGTRLTVLEQAIARLPPEWLTKQLDHLETRVTELERELAPSPPRGHR